MSTVASDETAVDPTEDVVGAAEISLPKSATFLAFLDQLNQPSAQHIARYLKK